MSWATGRRSYGRLPGNAKTIWHTWRTYWDLLAEAVNPGLTWKQVMRQTWKQVMRQAWKHAVKRFMGKGRQYLTLWRVVQYNTICRDFWGNHCRAFTLPQ